jgi:hypothetical protein
LVHARSEGSEPLSFRVVGRFKSVPQVSDYGSPLAQAPGAPTSRTNRRLSLFRKRGVFDGDHTAATASRAKSAGWLGLEIFRRHFLSHGHQQACSPASLRERQEVSYRTRHGRLGRRRSSPAWRAEVPAGADSFDRNESPSRSLKPRCAALKSSSDRNDVTFKEHPVANNKNPNEKQPGEKEPGTFHYNPGNMSGKTIGTNKDESEQSTAERPQDKKPSSV